MKITIMKTLKQKLAILLSASMILTGMVPAYAAATENIMITETVHAEENAIMEEAAEFESAAEFAESPETAVEGDSETGGGTEEPSPCRALVSPVGTADDSADASGTLLGEVTGGYLVYNASTGEFDEMPIPEDAIPLTSGMKNWGATATESWYVLNANVSISGRIQVEGSVNLILKDDCKLTVPQGIRVRKGTSLHIYAGEKGTGSLYISGPEYTNSGIGGDGGNGRSNPDEQCGDITIDGGIIEARGGENGAGIGTGAILSPACHENNGSVTINGGHVRAIGCESGAGIGGGDRNNSGRITINGGYVEAYVNSYRTYPANAAGIGGGYQGISNTIRITGGTIVAAGGGFSAGIGGGYQGGTETIHISGGSIRATAGKDGAAAIGSAVINKGGTVNISGGSIYAEAFYESGRNGAVIGGGTNYTGGGCKVNISGGRIDAITHMGVGKAMGNGTVTIIPDGKLIYAQKESGISYDGSPFSETTVLKDFGREVHIRELEKYEITWEYDGSRDVTQATEGELPKHDNPVKTGYAFRCWIPEVTPAAGDATYYAVFDKIAEGNVSVSFDTNGGSWINPQIIASGTNAIRPDNPEKKGFRFEDWYSDPVLTQKYSFASPVRENIVLYAKWTPESYTVSFDANYEGGIAQPASKSVVYHSPYGTMAVCEREGYHFDGWYTESAGGVYVASTSECSIAEDHTLYAHWIEKPKAQHIVSFNTNGGSYIDAQKITDGECAARPQADPTKTGYSFDDWYADAEFKNKFDFTIPVTSPSTVYARWNVNSYTINWLGGLKGDTLITSTREEYNSYPAFPKEEEGKLEIEGYVFSGWDPEFEPVTQDTSYRAVYMQKDPEYCFVTVRVTTGQNTNSIVRRIKKGNSIGPLSRPEYRFDGWYDNISFEGKPSATYGPVYSDTTIFARYIPKQFLISWMDGEVTLATEMCAYDTRPEYKGAPEKLQKEGYVFTGWTPEIVPVREAASYKAVFVSKSEGQCIVSFDSCGGTPVSAKRLNTGEKATPPEPEPERTGYHFDGWYRDRAYTLPFDFDEPVRQDLILFAKWIPKDYVITWNVDGRKKEELYSFGVMPDYGSVPVKDGFVFTGWDPALRPVEGETSYTAQFSELDKEKLIVDFNTLGGSHIAAQKLAFGDKAARPAAAPSRTDYAFTGWFEDAGGTKAFDFDKPVTTDITVYAGWKYTGSGHSSGGGGGTSVRKTGAPAGSVEGTWTYHAVTNTWTFNAGGIDYANCWAYVFNPHASGNQPAASWFYFDANGVMLTGWQWIRGNDGVFRCYYLNPVPDNTLGACFMGPGTTPDGFMVDANGAWTVNGIVQTR